MQIHVEMFSSISSFLFSIKILTFTHTKYHIVA